MLALLVFGCSLAQTDQNFDRKTKEQENALDQMSIQKFSVRYLGSVKLISTGSNHSLALKTNGTLWAAGNNFNGQLGAGNTLVIQLIGLDGNK